jgi:hypothetical protein
MSQARIEHERLCTRCNALRPNEAFSASALKSGRRMCASCTNSERTRTRHARRAQTLAVALRQREKRRRATSELTAAHIDVLLRASQHKSVWQPVDAAARLSIDRIALDRPLRLENAVVLTAAQVRSRARSAADPLPQHAREIAIAIAHAITCSE